MIRPLPTAGIRSFTKANSFTRGLPPVPVFTVQPQSQALYQENGLLTITGAVVAPATSYQWQKSTDGISWTDIAGQISANLSISSATGATGTYRLKAINGGSVTYSSSVDVVSVYLRIQNDSSPTNGSAAGTTKVTNQSYTHNAAAATRYWSAFYTKYSDDTAFTPNGASSARAVAAWATTNAAVLPNTPVSATGQLTCATKTGSATLTASVGNLSSTLAATIT